MSSFLYPLIYVGCKLWFGDRLVPLGDIDFESEFAEIWRENEGEQQGTSKISSRYDRVLNSLF